MTIATAYILICIILLLGFVGFSAVSLKFERRLHSETLVAVGSVFAILAGFMLALTSTLFGSVGLSATVGMLGGGVASLAFWTSVRPTVRAWYRLWLWRRHEKRESIAEQTFYDA